MQDEGQLIRLCIREAAPDLLGGTDTASAQSGSIESQDAHPPRSALFRALMVKSQRETGIAYRLARKAKELCGFLAQREFADEINYHVSTRRLRNLPVHLSALDEGQISIQFGLKHEKMLSTVLIPAQVIAY